MPTQRNPLAVEFGHRIYIRRLERRLSRDQLGELVRLSARRIGAIERGDHVTDIEALVTLRDALDLSWESLLDGLSELRPAM